MSYRMEFVKGQGRFRLTKNQVRVLMVMRKAGKRWITAAEVNGVKMPTFYRLREFEFCKSRMTPGGRYEPRHGLIWHITPQGSAYLDALIAQFETEEAA